MHRYFLISLLTVLTTSCNEADKRAEQPPSLTPQYFYFPRANVYFDSANKEYLFLANDSSNWQTAKGLPNVMQGLMDKSVYIPAPAQPVWKDNERHRLIYSSLLYATRDDTTVKKEIPKPVIKAPTDSTEGQKKKRKGFRRFVDKVFGVFKKDKKKKDTAQ